MYRLSLKQIPQLTLLSCIYMYRLSLKQIPQLTLLSCIYMYRLSLKQIPQNYDFFGSYNKSRTPISQTQTKCVLGDPLE